jgi:hypothetical protein
MQAVSSVNIPRSVGYRRRGSENTVSAVRHDGVHHDDALL